MPSSDQHSSLRHSAIHTATYYDMVASRDVPDIKVDPVPYIQPLFTMRFQFRLLAVKKPDKVTG